LYDWHYKHYWYVQEPDDIQLLDSTQAALAGAACKLNGLIDKPAETDADGSRRVAMHVPTPVYQKLPFGFAGRAASYGGQAVPVSKGATQPSAEAHRNCVDAGSDVAGVRDDLTYFDEMLTVLDADNYNTLQQTSYFWKWL
jgi:hypothetical protein